MQKERQIDNSICMNCPCFYLLSCISLVALLVNTVLFLHKTLTAGDTLSRQNYLFLYLRLIAASLDNQPLYLSHNGEKGN